MSENVGEVGKCPRMTENVGKWWLRWEKDQESWECQEFLGRLEKLDNGRKSVKSREHMIRVIMKGNLDNPGQYG